MSAWRLRVALIAAGILGYSLLEHYSNAAGAGQLGAVLASAPWLLALLLATLRAPRPWLAVPVAVVGCAALLLFAWPRLERNYSLLFLLQQCGVYCALAAAFGRSLLRGEEPLCTRWATTLHGALPAHVQRYTRRVTAAWTVFFLVIAAIGVALYVLAPRTLWSFYASFLTLPLTALMFLAEYGVRRYRLPEMCTGLLTTMRCFFVAHSAARNAAPPL